MASKSDHDKNRTNIMDLLPEVYRSDVSKSLFDATFNKFLTKDDTVHVAGYVGKGNLTALVDRQLPEPTPHRQAHQLAPVMYTKNGTTDSVLTFKGFQQQLGLMGVDVVNMDRWAATDRFNWIPPVNLDMLINYADYFWRPEDGQSPAQHFTVENRCNKAKSKLDAYKAILARRGSTLDIVKFDFALNAMVIGGKHDDIFVEDFVFITKGTNNINLADKTWYAVSSSYNAEDDQTTIVVTPQLSIITSTDDINVPYTPPSAEYEGQWWYRYSTNPATPLSRLYTWNGTAWVISSQMIVSYISLSDQEAIYQAEANCACQSDTGGWDAKQWDDGQQSALVWNTDLLAAISFGTEAEWLDANTQPSSFDLWHDTTADQLKQRSEDNTQWLNVKDNFSEVLVETTGQIRWDASAGCTPQRHTQWSLQNKWVHKSELTTFVGAKRAQVPILEYSSQTEVNEWTEVIYKWKYRSEPNFAFNSTEHQPHRFELEPIKSYVAHNVDGVWYLFLATERSSANRDIDFTNTFIKDYKFRIVDKNGYAELYTVESSWFRQVGDGDPADLPRGRFVTVIRLQETDFTAPMVAGVHYEATPAEPTPPYTRLEPIKTSRGDNWRGYHVHWVLDEINTERRAVAPQMKNPYAKVDNLTGGETITLAQGTLYLFDTYQEFMPAVDGIAKVDMHDRYKYNSEQPGYYAVVNQNHMRVYVNGIRQYGTYREISGFFAASPDYTIVDNVGLTSSLAPTEFRFVDSIQFDKPLRANDVVRIEFAPPSYADMGLYSVPVRTIEDDYQFEVSVLAKEQPQFRTLAKYHKNEQVKNKINQYPLFNIYDIITGEVVNTSPVFAFAEDTSMPVDPSTQRRIYTTDDGREFMFEQFLVDQKNGKLFAYRTLTDAEPEYWYSPLTQQLKRWDGAAWTTTILATIATGWIAKTPVVSTTEPTELLNDHMSVWVNPETLRFVQRDAINGIWNTLGDVVVADADPTLETLWKTSSSREKYVPKYVDGSGQEIEKGSTEGDWEVISQWRNNPEHENHKTILLSQLITHLSSIVTQQERIPGLINRGIFTKTQKEYDYGVGGTIKEHNDSFDALISAVNLDDVTPVGVIEFAQKQYAANMVSVRDVFTNTVVDALIEWSGYTVDDITNRIADRCITEFANNDFVARVFSDTTAYNPSTGTGMPNWIATAPMFGLAAKQQPYYVVDGNSVTMIHHDGHRTYFAITPAEQDRYARILVRQYNAAQPGLAVISTSAPTTSPIYWYKPGAGAGLYKRNGSEWDRVNFADMLATVFLAVERRLHDATPVFPVPPFDFSALTATEEMAQVYSSRMLTRFMDYVAKKNIVAPLVNTTYSLTDPFTWNYAQSVVDLPPRAGLTPAPRGCWQAVHQYWYGTPHPHLEPWCLQGYDHKPQWWDEQYAETDGTRRWKYDHAAKIGMWENIRRGIVPAGRYYPDGTVSTGNPAVDEQTLPQYNYFSVNIMDEPAPGGYQPDGLLPPYYDNTQIMLLNPTVRSVFRVFSTQIIAPDADYMFGQQGPTEWQWEVSAERVYDQSVVAFLIKPVEFFYKAYGNKYVEIGGLQVDATFKKVLSHKEAIFHGDIYDDNKLYKANGLNQWYVNFNRYNGFDTNVNFRTQWTQWTPRQSYQTAGIVDTTTLQVFNRNFDVTNRDYEVILAKSGVIKQLWADAFTIGLLSMPPAIVQFNNQAQWKFAVGTHAPSLRSVKVYGVQQWPVMVDKDTDEFTSFAFDIDDVTAAIDTFEVRGDQTAFFLQDVQFTVTGSTTNDGVYTVITSSFDTVRQTTRVRCVENVPTSIRDGRIDITPFAHNWQTGDIVVPTSNKALPYPLVANTPYYVIRIDDRKFKLALTELNASQGIGLDITSIPQGDLVVGKLKSTFNVFEGSSVDDVWFHLELNTDDIRTISLPTTIVGMQNLINFVDGYVQHQVDSGLVYNDTTDFIEYDSDTGRPVSWQVEIERMIDWAYSLRRSRVEINDRFQFVVSNVTDGTFRFTSSVPAWEKGKAITLSTSSSLPEPLFANVPYYFAPVEGDAQLFRLAVNPRVDDPLSIVEITTAGGGIHNASVQKIDQQFPTFNMNPMRNNLWVSTPQGMLSNVISGPYVDIRVSQTLYDQYGRNLTADKIVVYRHDAISRISVRPEIPNDVEQHFGLSDPYNYIHIGGAHLFVEGHEHILMFNNYTVGDDLVYDPFLGLFIQRFDLDFDKQRNNTLRPSLGGYYLSGNGFVRNIEGSIQDLRRYYDAYDLTEGTPAAAHARHTLGYNPNDGSMSYLDLLNVNAKSQFLFYRGMIQYKGSMNSVMAYVNSKKFVDAKMDEFWAYKIGEFGDSRAKVYPQLKLFTSDSTKADVRLKFTSPPDLDLNPIVDIQKGFETVTMTTGKRWVDYPEQREVVQSALFLDAGITTMTKLFISRSTGSLSSPVYTSRPPQNGFNEFDVWVNIHDGQPHYYTRANNSWSELTAPAFSIREVDNTVYFVLPTAADGVRVVARKLQQQGNLLTYTSTLMNEVDAANGYYRVNSEVIAFPTADIAFTAVDAPSNSIVVSEEDSVKFVLGDKVMLSTTNKIHTIVSVDPLTLRVRLSETITPTGPGFARQVGFTDLITIFTVNPSANKISAPRIKDVKSRVHIQDIPLWHPAIGIHSPTAVHNIDLITDSDPARYLNTITNGLSSSNPWLSPEVGTMWLDTSELGYKPYYDDVIYPDVDHRLHRWGKQQDWSSVRVYQWVETTIAPDRWVQVARTQAGDLKIAKQNRVTGTPKITVFKRMRKHDVATISQLTGRISTTGNNTYQDGDVVIFTDGATPLPATVLASQRYVVDDYQPADQTFKIVDEDGVTVDLFFAATVTVTKPFEENWVRQPVARERLYGATQAVFTTPTIREPILTLFGTDMVDGDVVDVYVNGELLTAGKVVMNNAVDTAGSEYNMTKKDIIDVVRPIHRITNAERVFNPEVEDDGTLDVQWMDMTEFSTVRKTVDGITYVYYYYWVEGITVERDIHDNASLSAAQVATEIATMPTPYTVVQDPQDHDWVRGFDVPPWDRAGYDQHQYTAYSNNTQYLPSIFYRKAVLNKIAPYIGEDDRYVIEFTRDLTLRSDIRAEHNELYGKNKHAKWYMFRREQVGAIPQDLWIKMAEALMGCKYNDFTVRVPSFEREHYDALNGTETKYGLGNDQIFANPEYARQTLVHYLQDPMNDFKPVDINAFFETYPATEDSFWTDPQRVKDMCDYIFNTFDSLHTNAIWFDILSDALATKSKYSGLMKTSWLALHGIRILDINGQFDDY